jgi:hypothetical protein
VTNNDSALWPAMIIFCGNLSAVASNDSAVAGNDFELWPAKILRGGQQ